MILNTTRHTTIARHVEVAQTPVARMKGLLGRDTLAEGHSLVITGCQSIHMMFMTFPIDVIFVNAKGVVVGVCPEMQPFQLSPVFFKANRAIELPSGTITQTQTAVGDVLKLD